MDLRPTAVLLGSWLTKLRWLCIERLRALISSLQCHAYLLWNSKHEILGHVRVLTWDCFSSFRSTYPAAREMRYHSNALPGHVG